MKTRSRPYLAGATLVAATIFLAAPAASAVSAASAAQHQHSPYAHEQSSEVASLTPEELAQLRNGDGMGLAKPAELNHFPGPRHVLELAGELALSDEQRARTEQIFAQMQESARELGARIIEAEKHLNMRFANKHIDDASLREATSTIAALYGQLRFTHLRAHLSLTELLTPEQIATYDRLRGYEG
jgi:Spy/CpxP family protein refolding chaperone